MPTWSKKDRLTAADLLRNLAEGVRKQATAPNIYGYVPHKKQREFHEAIKKARYRLYIGGNRAGKTTAGTAEVVWFATGTHPGQRQGILKQPPVNIRVIGPDFLNGVEKVLLPKIRQLLPQTFLRGGSWEEAYSREHKILHLENGSNIEYMSYEQKTDKFSGVSLDLVHFDEEPPFDIYVENMLRLLDAKGHWIMSLTPVQGMEWMYDEIYLPGINRTNPNISVTIVNTYDNTYLDPDEITTLLATIPTDEQGARIEGNFIKRGGTVFKDFNRRSHVISPGIPPRTWTWYASMDHGFSNPTAWLWHAVAPSGQIVTFDEHYANEMTVTQHAERVHEYNHRHGKVPQHYVGDPSINQRNAIVGVSVHSEYSRLGIPIALGNNDVPAGIAKMNDYLRPNLRYRGKPTWLITENCVNLISEMEKLRWKTWASKEMERKNNLHEVIHKHNDHAPDAARYFLMMMPDLAPRFQPNKTYNQIGAQLDAVTPIDPSKGAFDYGLIESIRTPTPQTEWQYEYADEYVGYY